MELTHTRQFPPKVPNIHAGSLEFERGYPVQCVEDLTEDSLLLCGICHMLPRNPIELECCGHLFCFPCLNQLVSIKNAFKNTFRHYQKANCPICRTEFSSLEYTRIAHLPSTLGRMYHSLEVNCPLQCGFKSDPIKMDEHQLYECNQRLIKCPNHKCDVVIIAQKLENVHFPKCSLYLVHCPQCKLPVSQSTLHSHNCMNRLKEALTDIYKYFHSHNKIIPPSIRIGQSAAPLYSITDVNRQKYLDVAKAEYHESDAEDEEDTLGSFEWRSPYSFAPFIH